MACCFAFLAPANRAKRAPEAPGAPIAPAIAAPVGPLLPRQAADRLREGNERFAQGCTVHGASHEIVRKQLEAVAQAPFSAVVGCSDLRAPLEAIFDAPAGEIFAVRNAGNSCAHAEGSLVGSLELCTSKLGTSLILVLGHTKCGAVYGATRTFLEAKATSVSTALEGLMQEMSAVAEQAALEQSGRSFEEIAAHAVRVNVFHTVHFLLKFSAPIRDKVRLGKLEVQGAIYDLRTGRVEFLGPSPRQEEFMSSQQPLPLSVARDTWVARPESNAATAAARALEVLKEGNRRFAENRSNRCARSALTARRTRPSPLAAVLGCADCRAPVDTVFDAPGDLFVLRNAGNTCTHAEGSILGSLEFCASKLNSKLILVLGHTHCGALAGAAQTYLKRQAAGEPSKPGALEGLLTALSAVAKSSAEELGGGFEFRDLARHSVKVNVFHSINFMLRCSSPLRELVKSGGLEIHGGIYHLETGRVEFLGQSPQQAELLLLHSPSVPQVHTSEAPILAPPALERLWAGNQRYLGGIHRSGSCDRKALVESQAPHTAIVGCADARTPFELLFDAMPGDIFTLRNAGNACTRAEGSMLGSLEFCAGLGTQLILVLGHSNCRALKSAAQVRHEGAADESPVDALLASLSVVCREAEKRLGPVSEEEVLKLATELNVLRSMDFLLKYSRLVRERVRKGELEVHGAIFDETGAVRFLGCSPQQQSLLECDAALDKVLGA
ncbi:unnamed protein product [Effrenium voratum]|uniref:carbonic anhydrase n=1 Tax=Effrenium voratum TaxID=2562239 RepID=A0AA36MSN1_9DINO|nr:unnamed protein product [Effrenium voratum]